jgi:flagellar biogenesis protein FliO
MIEETAILASTKILEAGVAFATLVLVIIGLAWAVRYLLGRLDTQEERLRNISERMIETVAKNNESNDRLAESSKELTRLINAYLIKN